MERKRTKLEWIMLVIVVAVASLVIASSFHNTAKLAKTLGMPTLLVAGTVEIAFTTFLFLRGRQRALRLNTPVFLHALYFGLLALVTGVNMWGLTDMHMVWGPIIGASISGLLWGMETTLVWLWTESHLPHRKTIREIEREADREIAEEQAIQRIEWKRHEARQPSLSLIRMVRKQEAKREKEIAKGLPQYFLREPEPTPELVAEPIVQETAVIPIRRPIGFHAELNTKNEHQAPNTETPDFSTIEHQSNTPKSNTKKYLPSNTPTKKEQAIQYVIGLIEKGEEYSVTTVANAVGCARSTASIAIREAKEKMMK